MTILDVNRVQKNFAPNAPAFLSAAEAPPPNPSINIIRNAGIGFLGFKAFYKREHGVGEVISFTRRSKKLPIPPLPPSFWPQRNDEFSLGHSTNERGLRYNRPDGRFTIIHDKNIDGREQFGNARPSSSKPRYQYEDVVVPKREIALDLKGNKITGWEITVRAENPNLKQVPEIIRESRREIVSREVARSLQRNCIEPLPRVEIEFSDISQQAEKAVLQKGVLKLTLRNPSRGLEKNIWRFLTHDIETPWGERLHLPPIEDGTVQAVHIGNVARDIKRYLKIMPYVSAACIAWSAYKAWSADARDLGRDPEKPGLRFWGLKLGEHMVRMAANTAGAMAAGAIGAALGGGAGAMLGAVSVPVIGGVMFGIGFALVGAHIGGIFGGDFGDKIGKLICNKFTELQAFQSALLKKDTFA